MDNLYSNSVVALDALTGQMRWHRQLVHHDTADIDIAAAPVLFDMADADGSVNFNDLNTPDPEGAKAFYRSVFGGQVNVVTYGDFGMPAEVPGAENVVFGEVVAENGFRVMAYDVPHRTAMAIDPRLDHVERFLEALVARDLRLAYALDTHTHADHVNGLDDLRSYNMVHGHPISVHGTAYSLDDVRTRFAYCFRPPPPGGGWSGAGGDGKPSPQGARAYSPTSTAACSVFRLSGVVPKKVLEATLRQLVVRPVDREVEADAVFN